MEDYNLEKDIALFGKQVTTFPEGIKHAFGDLMKTFGTTRAYYGISWFGESDNIIYYAMATQVFDSEAKMPGYETIVIPKGKYRTETIYNWLTKTDCIKDVFHDLMGDNKPDKTHPAIEWYRSDDEMLCMIKAN